MLTLGRLFVLSESIPARLMHPKARVITVAKGLCAPARDDILSAVTPYGVQPLHIVDRLEPSVFAEEDLYWIADVFVNPAQAGWTEYLLLRSGKFRLLSRPIDPRNTTWAAKHLGVMPTPWSAKASPWIEKGCASSQGGT